MIAVYYKSNDSQWKYELEETELDYIIKNLMEDTDDLDDMFDESIEILRDVSGLEDDELDEEEQIDQTVAIAFLWHYFNHLAPDDERIEGDIALIEDEDGTGVTVMPASGILEE